MASAEDQPEPRPTRGTDKPDGLRERKKRATRQLISDIATRLFTERGFEHVTIDDVAAAANVSKMTVFNYFPRKEELLFDRSKDAQELMLEALGERANRGRGSPVATLRALAHDLVAQRHYLVKVNARVAAFWKVVAASPVLRAYTRELSQELERDLGRMLAASVEAPAGDPTARLIAAVLVGAFRVAFREALRRHRSAPAATTRDVFLELLDRGFSAASAAARGTPYV